MELCFLFFHFFLGQSTSRNEQPYLPRRSACLLPIAFFFLMILRLHGSNNTANEALLSLQSMLRMLTKCRWGGGEHTRHFNGVSLSLPPSFKLICRLILCDQADSTLTVSRHYRQLSCDKHDTPAEVASVVCSQMQPGKPAGEPLRELVKGD